MSMYSHSFRSSHAFAARPRTSDAATIIPSLEWTSLSETPAEALVLCDSSEHLELVCEQLTDQRITMISVDKNTLVVCVDQKELERKFPNLFSPRQR